MEFRPCIDIHNGKVKQIVGGSLRDEGDHAKENFVSGQDAAFFARLYRDRGLAGGHVILLNHEGSEYYDETRRQELLALREYPGGLQAGGGIRADNAADYLDAGASHVIVTSWVFRDGRIDRERLERMERAVGKDRLVLDLSCRRKDGAYYIVTDRWQKFTGVALCPAVLDELASHCAEFLIHAVDVEGRARGVERDLVRMLGAWEGIPVTYAGGVGSCGDLAVLKELGRDRLNVTAGSALDLFGGPLNFEQVVKFVAQGQAK